MKTKPKALGSFMALLMAADPELGPARVYRNKDGQIVVYNVHVPLGLTVTDYGVDFHLSRGVLPVEAEPFDE